MEKRKKLKEFEIPILNEDYKVYLISGDEKSTIQFVNEYHRTNYRDGDISGVSRGLTFYKEGYHPIIWIRRGIKYPLSTVAHEAVHAINHIWDYIEESSKDEIFAHSVGSIVRVYETKLRNKENGKQNER